MELRGDPSLAVTQISLKAIERIFRKEKKGILVELSQLISEKVTAIVLLSQHLLPIIHKYQAIYNDPKNLPPPRNKDHAIVLKEGTNPVSVRPYRYPQIQKDEIEKMVLDMLKALIV